MLLCELRSNPDRNPRQNIVDILAQYRDRDDVYVSFTQLNKLGVNPKSAYKTPLGIYAYPVKQLWSRYLEPAINRKFHSISINLDQIIPFAGGQPHAVLFSCPEQPGMISDFDSYTAEDFARDIKILVDVATPYSPSVRSDMEGYVESARNEANVNSPIGRIWYITYALSQVIEYRTKKSAPAVWNALLRRLGFIGISDTRGLGMIHENEPMQALFLTTKNLKIIGTYYNKYHDPKFNDTKAQTGQRAYDRKKEMIQVTEWFYGKLFGRKVNPNNIEDFSFMVEQIVEMTKGVTIPERLANIMQHKFKEYSGILVDGSALRRKLWIILGEEYPDGGSLYQACLFMAKHKTN